MKLTVGLFNVACETKILELIKWLGDRNCPFSDEVFYKAVSCGNISILNWFANNDRYKLNYVDALNYTESYDVKQWLFDKINKF
jgi:hypothetical protein